MHSEGGGESQAVGSRGRQCCSVNTFWPVGPEGLGGGPWVRFGFPDTGLLPHVLCTPTLPRKQTGWLVPQQPSCISEAKVKASRFMGDNSIAWLNHRLPSSISGFSQCDSFKKQTKTPIV